MDTALRKEFHSSDTPVPITSRLSKMAGLRILMRGMIEGYHFVTVSDMTNAPSPYCEFEATCYNLRVHERQLNTASGEEIEPSSRYIQASLWMDLPNETEASDNYTLDPLPAETNPPMGQKLLHHLLEHPEHAEVLPELHRTGRGIQLVKGLNWLVIFLFGCMGFSAALVSSIVWSVVRNDVHGGFAIAGFMLAFFGILLGHCET